ncbi:hypothetical protein [uncultured Desulfuromusa sp.]|uniref:hypothetical protein n=1 Tax=uncultured Desulfuromusa sp. TaxID=219183 RepID=UPI002AA7BDAE|nr:hypothetical protein [uncultured Desulfuromusa sp.]
MTPLQFLNKRFSALMSGDYGFVYDSYHCDAPFLRQFHDRKDYIDFARQQLASIVVTDWRCLRHRIIDEKQQESLLVMNITVGERTQFFYELALLIETGSGWRYHSAQKLGVDDYTGSPDLIDFSHFDTATPKIRF